MSRSIKDSLFVILIFIINNSILVAQNQQYQFEHLSANDGLSQGSISCITQDSKGFMWFGTKDGLNKFDGYNFIVFRRINGDTASISNNWILSIFEDSRGYLWVGTNGGGVCRFDPVKNSFQRFLYNTSDSNSIINNVVNAISEDNDGILWFGTRGGLNKYDPTTKTFTHFVHDPKDRNSLSNSYIESLYSPKHGNKDFLYVGTNLGGLSVLYRKTGRFKHYFWDSYDRNPLNGIIVKTIAEDTLGNIWAGGFCGGLSKLDTKTWRTTNYLVDQKDTSDMVGDCYRAISFDKNGNLWIGTDDTNLMKFNTETKTFDSYDYQKEIGYGSRETGIWSLFIDRSGLLWIGSNGFGMFYSQLIGKKFNNIINNPTDNNSISFSSARAIYVDANQIIWAGGYPGLNKIDKKNNKIEHFFGIDPVYSVCEDPDNSQILWVGTEGRGFFQFNKQTNESYKYKSKHAPAPDNLCGSYVYEISADSYGDLWIGTDRGLNRFDRTTEKFEYFGYSSDNPQSIADGKVKIIFEDSQKNLLIGTTIGGISLFNRETNTFTRFTHNEDNPKSLSSNQIFSFCESKSGVLWIGTANGINKLDRESLTFNNFTVKDGLPNNVIYGILEDEKGNLWLSTNLGLSKFNPNDSTFTNYDVDDGLQGNEFNTASYFKSKSGEMFFGGVNGITYFYPHNFRKNQFKPPVVLTAFKKFNKKVSLEKHISATKELELTYKDAVISFEFAGLNFYKSQKNQYAYMLEGFHDKWIELGTKRDITFTSLPSGEYILKIKASNNDGVWNDKSLNIRLNVFPPPWKTWWAYTIYILTFFVSTLLFIRWRARKIIIEKKKLEKTVAIRTEELRELNSKMDSEMKQAASYIESLLPEKLITPIKTDWKFIPSSQLGGDSFGYCWLNEDKFLFYMIDVSGHGVGAALLTTTIMDIIKSQTLPNTNFANPADVLNCLNKTFDMKEHEDKFFAIWYGVIDKNSMVLTTASAMHPPAVCIGKKGLTKLGEKDIMIGAFPDYKYENTFYQLDKGDKIYLFSDGCFEIEKNDGINLDFDEFVNIIEKSSTKDLNSLEDIYNTLVNFKMWKSFEDDYSMVEIELKAF